jgi:hypothetical protein
MAQLVVEGALHVIKSDAIPRRRNLLFHFINRVKLTTIQDFFNNLKSQKSHELMSGEYGGWGSCEG